MNLKLYFLLNVVVTIGQMGVVIAQYKCYQDLYLNATDVSSTPTIKKLQLAEVLILALITVDMFTKTINYQFSKGSF